MRQWLLVSNVEVFKVAGIYGSSNKLAESLSALVLSVRLVVPLVNMGIETKVGGFGVSFFSGGGEYGVVEASPRIVEAGTVVSFLHNGQVAALALQKPVPLAELNVVIEYSGDDKERGRVKGSGGLTGALFGAGGRQTGRADALVKIDAASFEPALLQASGVIFKDLAQTMASAK